MTQVQRARSLFIAATCCMLLTPVVLLLSTSAGGALALLGGGLFCAGLVCARKGNDAGH